MIDLHTHVLPAIDDGPATMGESLEMLAEFAAAGVEAVAATPHVRDDYPTTAAVMEDLVSEVRGEAVKRSLGVQVLPGGEIALERIRATSHAELRRFGLAGNPRYLLVEFPYYGWPPNLAQELESLRSAGFRVVLAHPERNAEVQAGPARLGPLVESNVLVQITAASVSGALGRRCQSTAMELIDLHLAHFVASDTHGPGGRIGLAAALRHLADVRLAQWLTSEVPLAIVAGEPIPPRPAERRRGLWRRM